MLNIICINSGNYLGRGAEYVAKLHDMVKRNLPEGFPGKFVCFTDDPADYGPEIEKRPLPHDGLKGWFNKLALFKAGLFPDGDRVLFFDLDTAIVGPLDTIAAYAGSFAILRDFYRPYGLGSAVLAWEVGRLSTSIWDFYVTTGFSEPPGGDQSVIEDFFAAVDLKPDLWQNVFPGDFVSYKRHAKYGIPKGAKVVVFHGLPRPHECGHVEQNVSQWHYVSQNALPEEQAAQRHAMQSMQQPAASGAQILQGLRDGAHEGMAQNSSFNGGSAAQGFGQEIRGDLQAPRQADSGAMPGLRAAEGGNAPRGLQQAAQSDLALPSVPSEASRDGGWVPHVWRIGGGTTAELVTTANVDREVIMANVRSACARKGVKWLHMAEAHYGVALVCAGGPSLKDELGSIRAHQDAGAKVYAVNNSALFLAAHGGIDPDAQVILDARPENLSFVHLLVDESLFASQCDPAVLDAAGTTLVCWHPLIDCIFEVTGEGDGLPYIGGCTTAGLSAVVLAYVQGFRKVHMYGFDSCYRGDQNHAYAQPLNDGERIVECIVDGVAYRCAPWMATQADDFRQLAPELIALGCELYVHGSGLIPALAEAMGKSDNIAHAEIRAQEILKRVNGAQNPVGAEIGVFAGDLSKRLLGKSPRLKLYMIDSWGANTAPEFVASGDFHSTLTQDAQDLCYEVSKAVTSFAGNRATVIRKRSVEAAQDIPDNSLDFAFIDADHSYEGCRDDIKAWFPKVKPGGLLCGHDYENNQHAFGPMVKQAVDEFIAEKRLLLDLGENWTWFAVKP